MASFDEQVEFTRKYAQLAIDQHIKYGIPASVTLAQMAVESSWDKSGLAERANNCFGVTAGNSWKGPTVKEYDDNRWKDFRVYNSKEDSIEDHSRVLLGSNYMRYCAHLSSTDHLGWIKGIKAAGYATAPDYVSSIENVIKSNGFEKLDQMALEQAAQQGVRIGYMRGRQNEYKSSSVSSNISKEKKYILSFMPGTFSLPMNTNNMIVTSERGERNLGLKGASRNHKGIDIKADNDHKYRCLRLTYYEYEDDKWREIANFYVTDDSNHIPVRLDMRLKFGSAKAFLVAMKGINSPVTSQVR